MRLKGPEHHKRWTLRLFEWGVLTCIVLILFGVFLRKVPHLQAEAERMNVKATVENLRAAVLLASIIPQERTGLSKVVRVGSNPVVLLKGETGLDLPEYLGELEKPDPYEIEPGHWYFDRSQQALVYHLRNTMNFESSLIGPPRVRFCVRAAADGRADYAPLQLKACEPYQWGMKKKVPF